MNVSRTETIDGFEMHIGVNHLGHFLLTNLLLDTLRASAPSQIINVSSRAHLYGSINKNDLMLKRGYFKWWAYCQSKLANILFTRQLAKILQDTGVTANCLHPGVVKTELVRYHPILRILFYPAYVLFKTPEAGAKTTLAVALNPKFKSINGKYFSDCEIVEEKKAARDDEMAEWLWRTSEQLTGVNKINFKTEVTQL